MLIYSNLGNFSIVGVRFVRMLNVKFPSNSTHFAAVLTYQWCTTNLFTNIWGRNVILFTDLENSKCNPHYTLNVMAFELHVHKSYVSFKTVFTTCINNNELETNFKADVCIRRFSRVCVCVYYKRTEILIIWAFQHVVLINIWAPLLEEPCTARVKLPQLSRKRKKKFHLMNSDV